MIVRFQRERVLQDGVEATQCLNRILDHSYLALDIGEHCVTEYYETLPGPLSEEVKSWLTLLLNNGKLRLLPFGNYQNIIRQCRQAGLPNKDHRWVKLCTHGCVTHLFTDDIDFYDPTVKNGSANQKHRAKIRRRGAMLRLIEREANITIFCPEHLDDIFPVQEDE
ncbi:hypothetical protein [Qipengyuania mesophila]|uniref:hypothetical protein n=1 Tax=Qipengyuania mesophila TaxID=2867246 RepID=UPI0035126D0D